MTIEYMDIVDENDNVIGKDTRKAVHDQFKIHRGVHILVVNNKGEILIQKRSMNKDYCPGYYDISAGGQVPSGEAYEQAAHRELFEELGCDHAELTYLTNYNAYSDRQREKRSLFLYHNDGPFSPNADEVDEVEFLSIAQIEASFAQRKYTEGFQKSFKIYLDYLRNH